MERIIHTSKHIYYRKEMDLQANIGLHIPTIYGNIISNRIEFKTGQEIHLGDIVNKKQGIR